jgi:aspartyl-tRNA(Asn)/glutamyl-tRNA(Gln) amidotransferase subunit B
VTNLQPIEARTDSTAIAQEYEPVIGLEVHAQLLTNSKMYCTCSARYANSPPNTHVCAVCGGMPGSLPVINARAVEYTVRAALALDCRVDESSKFDRKNYPYADLPKGYQISQYDMPIGQDGVLEFRSGDETRRCGIVRVHLEEDTGKTTHTSVDGREVSLVDYNRSGVPLMEIVSRPELHSPEDAREYFATLRQILMFIGVCDGNLQEGSMRADVNVSIRRPGEPLGTKVEIKNLNSFRAVQRSLEFEIARQSELLERGESVVHETRGWSEERQITLGQRTKEQAHDYRYFPEPDLPYLRFTESQLDGVRSALPELPAAKRTRFHNQYELPWALVDVLTAEYQIAAYFEETLGADPTIGAAMAANWISGEMLRLLKETNAELDSIPVTASNLAALLGMVQRGAVSNTAAKTVLEAMFQTGEEPSAVVAGLGLERIGDSSVTEELVDQALRENPSKVEQYLAGKVQVMQSIFGDVMKLSKGKADPGQVRDILQRKLDGVE